MFKKYIQKKLQTYVRKYFVAHPEVKLVLIGGSVGKTSTKIATATVLSEYYKVRLHEGNHNTHLSAPLAILGIDYPENIKSLGAWWSVFRAAKRRIKDPADVDVIVQELGIDHVGDMAVFGRYLLADIGVVTSVTEEHMETFQTIEAVAKEELLLAEFSKMVLINRDDIAGRFASYLNNSNLSTYGTSGAAEYRFVDESFTIESGHVGLVVTPKNPDGFQATIDVVGEHNLRPAIAAAAVASQLGMTNQQIAAGLAKIRPVHGRMNILRGVNDSMIIDDSYNSSPLAASSALQTLYTLQAPQRIAVLGSMNELGVVSQQEHTKLGKLCDPNALAWVVTVGTEANNFIASAAKAQGCQVMQCKNALEAGAFVHRVLDKDAVVLFKGSQGDVYLEEGIKVILHTTEDEDQLVRQSASWMATKSKFFSQF